MSLSTPALRICATVLASVAQRDLTARMQRAYQGDFDRIKQALNSATANLESSLKRVSASADQVTAASGEINSSSQSLARGASEQASMTSRKLVSKE